MRILQVIAMVAAFSWLSRAQVGDVSPDVVIYVEADGPVELGPLRLGKNLATSMFAGIGVSVGWSHEPYPVAECSGQTVRIRLRLRTDTPRNYLPRALAEAFPFDYCDQTISVMYDRVIHSAGKSTLRFSRILAHVFVHEVSHVVQVLAVHSDSSLMKARWDSDDYTNMAWRPLPFLERDIYLIHLGLKWLRNRANSAAVEPVLYF
jgi:hypothetical protein